MGRVFAQKLAVVAAFTSMLLLSSFAAVFPIPVAYASTGTLTVTKSTVLTEDHYGNILIAANDVTLDGNGHTVTASQRGGNGVYIQDRDNVTIRSLRIRNFGQGISLVNSTGIRVINNIVSGNSYGIHLRYVSGSLIANNNASYNTIGIYLIRSGNQSGDRRGNLVINNSASHGLDGILLGESLGNIISSNVVSYEGRGIYLFNSNRNILTGNTVSRNPTGVGLDGRFNIVVGNTISYNGEGIFLQSINDTITENTISNSYKVGIRASTYYRVNKIYHNNLVDQQTHVSIDNRNYNLFNLPAPIGGNYWSNYDTSIEGCVDTSPADGFCDKPLVFAGGQDNLPWAKMNGWRQQPSSQPVSGDTYTLSFLGYDYNNKEEVSIFVNNQLVATLPTIYAPQNKQMYIDVSIDISKLVIDRANNVTFRENIYSTGVRNVRVTGPSGLIYSNNSYYNLWNGVKQSVTYKFNVNKTGNSNATTTPIKHPASGSNYTLSFQGYDYDSKGEVTLSVNDQVIASLPVANSAFNNNVFKNYSLDITHYVASGINTITFKQNLYSSGVKDLRVIKSGSVVYSNSTFYAIWVGGVKQSITYSFNAP